MSAIELKEITKKYNGFHIDQLSLQVPKGYITGFIGPNGAGKSTIIRMIMDLVIPERGQITILGKPHTEKELKKNIGFVYDSMHLYEDFTIKKAKSFIKPFYPSWDEQLFEKYLQKFELPTNLAVKTFSKGMQMKTSLLFALSHRPELIIMDEPTAGLDPVFRRELLEELQELMVNDKQTIFFSTHITQDLDKIADHIIFISKGKLQFQKGMDEINSSFYVVKGAARQLDGDMKQMLSGYQLKKEQFTGLYEGDINIFSGLEDEFVIERASLEDIMYFMTKMER